jgi:hypothetical protein
MDLGQGLILGIIRFFQTQQQSLSKRGPLRQWKGERRGF